MSEALDRVFGDMRAYSAGIARCRTSPFNAADLEDAYNRLNRLRDRFHKERPNLEQCERNALGACPILNILHHVSPSFAPAHG